MRRGFDPVVAKAQTCGKWGAVSVERLRIIDLPAEEVRVVAAESQAAARGVGSVKGATWAGRRRHGPVPTEKFGETFGMRQ
jgi:hypothetical protein